MIRSFIINSYLAKEFLKVCINISLFFFCLGFIVNLFEEINLFKDYDVGINVPIVLSLLFVPSLIYNMFPFVILLTGIWFFLKIKRTDEIIAMRISGMSSLAIIMIPSLLSIILGIFFITLINPITSVLVKKYESIKSIYYDKETDYLAAVTENGIWIKEKQVNNDYIVKSSFIENQSLMDVTIYEFDSNNNFLLRVDAESADISSVVWKLRNATVINREGNIIIKNSDDLKHQSIYDINKLKSLYSNLDTISFWNLEDEILLLEERGYSTNEMRAKKQRSFAFPFFLLSMVLISSVFTIGMQVRDNNWTYVFIAIITSVLIFYFNDFSAALGKTGKLPIEVSVWMPTFIIFLFSVVGLIHANQK
ncbi:MAG: lipopolysaccharide export system permease protein [Pelagibacterales bacterium]|nr:lipopolysaccharide export system permease protein [Pelagibacterales bacterium]